MVCKCGNWLHMHTKSEHTLSYEWTEKESPESSKKGTGNRMHYSPKHPRWFKTPTVGWQPALTPLMTEEEP